ncbi:MAG TPA: methionyl-tRNA formyltransferase [Thermoanaerobaculia bacterium]|nr:methionyl-tRNA formyltransferase [Thermoanaerobaculia bacterium]
MRVVFFGTPAFAVPTLDAIAREHDVAIVVAQPDKPAGRGMRLQSPAVVVRARELGLAVAQPARIRDFTPPGADAAIVVAYGKILPAALLAAMPFYNVHASLLPKYRGAAPIQRAIERGETETGVTIMRIDEQLDHGPMLLAVRTAIDPDEHSPALGSRLSALGAEAMLRVLRERPAEVEQDHARATLAPKIEKEEGLVDWRATAKAIYDKFRAFDPWPGIFTSSMKLIEVAPADGRGEPGTIVAVDDGVVVACGEGALRVRTIQRAGKPRAAAADVARAEHWRRGEELP